MLKDASNPRAAIIRTLLYARVFGAQLEKSRLSAYLISDQALSDSVLDRELATLAREGKITLTPEWIGWGKRCSFAQAKLRRQISEAKLKRLKRWLKLIAWIPTICGIAVTGSVAVGNAKQNEDIDLMVITTPGFLWLTRLIVVGIFTLGGVLRTKDSKQVKDKLCLNLWLDSSDLAFQSHNVYIAREIVQAVWVLDRKETKRRFLTQNLWAKKITSGGFATLAVKNLPARRIGRWAWVLLPLELLAFRLQKLHMGKLTREVVQRHRAMFHPRDTGASILRSYFSACGSFGVDSAFQPLDYYTKAPQCDVIRRVGEAKRAGKRIVIASGVFDLLHAAHREYLKNAKNAGDYLVVLVESDRMTKKRKGEGRPIWNQQRRQKEIKKLPYVDEVMILPPEFDGQERFEEIVILLSPDIYAQSSSSVALPQKRKLLEKYQGKVKIVLNHMAGISTTSMVAERKI